ncbi:similar to stage IV sporulation protein [Paenibacillus sp. UNC496MF]|uniref:sporulation protein YqfD n=1 Tax=Paenibacillus sp. UNC496MF TaxID=1502753 RepID=UPI0008E1AA26|nr:sporulation protein YqfD [Paenibacillus sp. UNC496MF]SFI61482.1 similar to stage IV sporulation protein [Paenibacillus sp. UNC496MF]
MDATWMQWLRGYVAVTIRGQETERLVNEALADGLRLWSIRRTKEGELLGYVVLGDFFRLRPLLKRTGCRVHVRERLGMPFWLQRMRKRVFFAAGLVLFFVGMYLLSSLVWSIDVQGNDKLSEEQILQAAKAEGLYPFQWSFRLEDSSVLSRHLAQKLPGAAWIGVEKRGTHVTIRIVESATPEPKAPLNPRHLVASTDAVVTKVMAESGNPVVRPNMKVKQGDVLISGLLGDAANGKAVVAKGEVKGIVWHEYDIVSPLTRTTKVYTGNKKVIWYGVAGGRGLQVSGFGKIPFAMYERVTEEERAAWRTLKLPFGRMKETIMEVKMQQQTVSVEEAKAEGIEQAKADLLAKVGPGAQVLAENILHEKTDNGKVYLKVFFEVDQSIVKERPLVQMQGD